MQAEVVKQVQAGHRQNSEDKRTGGALTWHCWVCSRDVRGGLLFRGAGRGEGKNPRGGAKVKIRGAGRGEKARKSTNSKIVQKCKKYNITYYYISYNIIIIL